MPLTRPKLEVWLDLPDDAPDDTPPDHVVTISSGDQLRAELEAKRLGLPSLSEAPLNSTALWLWAAMARQGLTQLKAGEFMANLPEFEPVKRPDGTAEVEQVDPTRAAP